LGIKNKPYNISFKKWLPLLDAFRTLNWNKIQQDLEFSGITKESYEEKLQELKHKQLRLGVEIDLYTKADKDYLLTVSKVLSLATRVKTIFESSEIHEKRALLNYLIQNPTLNGKKLYFTIASPYNLVLDLASKPTWLRVWDEVRMVLINDQNRYWVF
jgi:hypothetical protein